MKKIITVFILVTIIIISVIILLPKKSMNTLKYSVDYYKSLQVGTPFSVITEKIGQPDADIGSGVHIFVYRLPDNSEIWLGYTDLQKLLYVKQKTIDGKVIDIVGN